MVVVKCCIFCPEDMIAASQFIFRLGPSVDPAGVCVSCVVPLCAVR